MITIETTVPPIDRAVAALREAATPTEADLRWVGEQQKSRILDRTRRGLNVDGVPFTGYTTNGPYYYYPNKGWAGVTVPAEKRGESAARLRRKLGGAGTRTPLGIKFANYGAFKWSLGRSTVDLTGPKAPHMLQSLMVKVEGLLIRIGIYGPEAARAQGHNEGTATLPQRKFLGVGVDDWRQIFTDLMTRVSARARGAISRVAS